MLEENPRDQTAPLLVSHKWKKACSWGEGLASQAEEGQETPSLFRLDFLVMPVPGLETLTSFGSLLPAFFFLPLTAFF